MKHMNLTALGVALLLSTSGAVRADTSRYGQVYKVFPEQNMIKIDGYELTIYKDLHISNLAGGSDDLGALTPGTYVRYTLGDDGHLKAISIYPSDPGKRFELGYDPSKLQQ